MGFRFQKRINLGGGFRINISKSGIGYSWGTKGYTVTKKSTGGIRTTISIPGTGLAHVSETGKHSANGNQSIMEHEFDNTYDTEDIVNDVASGMVSAGLEDMLAMASRLLKVHKLIKIALCVTLLLGWAYENKYYIAAVVLFAVLHVFKKKAAINLDYEIDEDMRPEIADRMRTLVKITQCDKVWRLMQTSKVRDKKYTGGASNLVTRERCITSTEATFPFKTTEPVASFRNKKEVLLFLPDKLLIMQPGGKIGALNYSDIDMHGYKTTFVESEKVPKDATIVNHTWEYVNKSGGPDNRFKRNKRIPVCLYGELHIKSDSGLNTVIMFSNPNV